MRDHAEPQSTDVAPEAITAGAGAAAAVLELTATGVLALQAAAGNRAARKVVADRRLLQRVPRRNPADAVWGYIDDDDWARAAWALGQLAEPAIREHIEDMT